MDLKIKEKYGDVKLCYQNSEKVKIRKLKKSKYSKIGGF